MLLPPPTSRLHFSPITKNDAAFLIELMNDEDFIQYVGDRNVKSLEEAKYYIELNHLKSYENNNFGFYAVKLNDDETPIGTCGFIDREGIEGIEIGYAFLSAYRGKGYALEAALEVAKFGLKELHFPEIVAIVNEHNSSSIKLLEKIGLSYKKRVNLPKEKIELLYFSS